MYLRTTQSRLRDGSAVRYLQLAHNHWDSAVGQSKVKVLYNFGREDQVDRAGIERLIQSLSRVLDPDRVLALTTAPGLRVTSSCSVGGTWFLDGLWRKLGADRILSGLLRGRRLDPKVERVVFAMVANRALEPLSKLSCARWVSEKTVVPGLLEVDEDSCYRSMDFLLAVEAELARQAYWAVADLVNLEVDLLFFDTSSTYFEIEQADPPRPGADKGFRTYNGNSKDHRPDLPQVVIGMAVTREGIPIRIWTFPGNASDQELIRQVKDDLLGWKLGRVVWVADTGFCSEENRRHLQRAGGHYILGEKLRGNDQEALAALSRQGRYQKVRDNLEVKEVVLDQGTMRDRFVICRNPEEATRDATVRQRLLRQLEELIGQSDELAPGKRSELLGQLRKKPGLARFLRQTPKGLLRIDRAKVAADQQLDGKYLLRSSDPTLSAEDLALGYRQLLQVERGWRDLKTRLDLRPVYHHKESRIRAHVVLCWLALLLIRLAENATHDTWRNLRWELEKVHLVEFDGPAGSARQLTPLTPHQAAIFRACGVPEPARYASLNPATPVS